MKHREVASHTLKLEAFALNRLALFALVAANLSGSVGSASPADAAGILAAAFGNTIVSSYADGVRLEQGDQVVIEWDGFGRPLRNFIERL